MVISAIVLVIAGFIRYLIQKFSYLFNPPLRIHLVPEAAGKGRSKVFEQHRRELDSRSFDEIGTFRIPEMSGLMLTAFTQPYQNVCAVVYNHPIVGCFIDMFSENEESRSLTVSSAPLGEELDQPPGREKIIDKTLTVSDLYDLILKDRPAGPHKRIDASNFVVEFQAAYAKEMDWRVNRGGVTEEEVRRSAQVMGIASDKTVRKATEKLRDQYASKQRILPCEKHPEGDCSYDYEKNPRRDIEGMPFVNGDPRSCPKYGHICPEFMEDFGLTTEDLHIRASIHCGALIDELVKQGKLTKESPEYREQKHRYENMRRLYPKGKYPQYY